MDRCKLCGIPIEKTAKTDFCSARCMHWHFHGIPYLKRREFARERILNVRKDSGDGHDPGRAYEMGAPWKAAEPTLTEITASYYTRLNGEES